MSERNLQISCSFQIGKFMAICILKSIKSQIQMYNNFLWSLNSNLVKLMSTNLSIFHPKNISISSNSKSIPLFEYSWVVGTLEVVVLVSSDEQGSFHRWCRASRNYEHMWWNILRPKGKIFLDKFVKMYYKINSASLHMLTLKHLGAVFCW